MSPHPRKRFGQNFLHDRGVIERILQAMDPRPGDAFVEIGPGQGALTLPLLERLGRLDVIELDRDLIPGLEQRCSGAGELRVHAADALRFDFCALARGSGQLRLVGNLPYNISTPLLFHALDQAACITDMHFMLQREVVERMAAAPGGGTYGRLSVMVQMRCRVEALFDIGPGAFRPRPKVESTVVRLTPYPSPPVAVRSRQDLARVVNAAFAKRRKTLRNALRGVLDERDIRAAGIDPGLRPERLGLREFAALADALNAREQA